MVPRAGWDSLSPKDGPLGWIHECERQKVGGRGLGKWEDAASVPCSYPKTLQTISLVTRRAGTSYREMWDCSPTEPLPHQVSLGVPLSP